MAAKPSPKPRMARATNNSLMSERCADVPSTRNLLETPSVAQSLDGYLRLKGSLRFPGIDFRSARRRALQRTRRQRIAARNLAAIEAVGEPALALLGGAVGE